jgi:hypothetical protein
MEIGSSCPLSPCVSRYDSDFLNINLGCQMQNAYSTFQQPGDYRNLE